VKDEPSAEVIARRIHNRILEYFELASSRGEQLCYEHDVPIADVPAELICMWSDQVPYENPDGHFVAPAFSVEEQAALCKFHIVWQRIVQDIPDRFGSLSEFQATPHWSDLRDAAKHGLLVFRQRGHLPED